MASNQTPDDYCRFNANIRVELHRKLKMASVMLRMPMGDIIQRLIQSELDALIKKGFK